MSECIEYIPCNEADLRCRKEPLIKIITDLRKGRDDWMETELGKELERVKGRRTRLHNALKECLALNNIVGINEGAA